MSELNLDQLCQALEAVERYGSVAKAAKVLGLPRTTLRDRVAQAKRELVDRQGNLKECVKTTETDATLTVSYVGKKIVTIEDLIKDIDIDMNVFEIDRVDSTNWEVGGKLKDSLWKMPLRRIRAVFRRKSDERLALENLLELV